MEDEIYLFRPGGSVTTEGNHLDAYFSSSTVRTTFHDSSNPFCFLPNGDPGNIHIKNISSAGNTINFDVRFCEDIDLSYSNTNSLPGLSNAKNKITTSGSVTVKATDNVTFEAGNEVLLNPGFELQQGGLFEINMNGCGDAGYTQ